MHGALPKREKKLKVVLYLKKHLFTLFLHTAKDNVDKIKTEFKEEIQLDLIIKDVDQGIQKTYFNIDQVANYLKIEYTPQALDKLLL